MICENQIKNNDLEVENTEFLGYSGKESGFVGTWFRVDFSGSEEFPIPLFKVGFKSGDKQKNVNNIYVQLLGSGIYFLGFLEVLKYAQKWFTSLLGVNVSLEHFINSRVLNEIFASEKYIEPGQSKDVSHIVAKYLPIGSSKEEVINKLNQINQNHKEESNIIHAGYRKKTPPMVPQAGVRITLKFNMFGNLENIDSELSYAQ